jgi:Rrf2 family transcriptional regulator, iron-sulfur cluster assembly transcription factor
LLNQSAEYALRAMLYIANQGRACKASAVAQALGVPGNYLAKVLNQLARVRVLRSERGPTGGFSLARPAYELTLDAIVEPFQQLQSNSRCLMGDRPCDHARPCAAHQHWSHIKSSFTSRLRHTTLAELVEPFTPDTSESLRLTEVA